MSVIAIIVYQAKPYRHAPALVYLTQQREYYCFVEGQILAQPILDDELLERLHKTPLFWCFFGGQCVNPEALPELRALYLGPAMSVETLNLIQAELEVFRWVLLPCGSELRSPCFLFLCSDTVFTKRFLENGTLGSVPKSSAVLRQLTFSGQVVVSHHNDGFPVRGLKFCYAKGMSDLVRITWKVLESIKDVGLFSLAPGWTGLARLNTENAFNAFLRDAVENSSTPLALPITTPESTARRLAEEILNYWSNADVLFTNYILSELEWCILLDRGEDNELAISIYGDNSLVTDFIRAAGAISKSVDIELFA